MTSNTKKKHDRYNIFMTNVTQHRNDPSLNINNSLFISDINAETTDIK